MYDKPAGPMNMGRVVTGGAMPQPKMPQPSVPFALGHGGQPAQAPPTGSTNIFGQQRTPQIQQLIDQVRNSGIGKGYTQGGWNMGMAPGLGSGPLPPQPAQPAASSPADESAIQQIISAMTGMGKEMPGQAQALNQAAQGAYAKVPGKITQQMDPKVLQQILLAARGGK